MNANDITIVTLYGILRDAVANFPQNADSCKQLQSFRVLQLQRAVEIGTDSRGATYADRDTVYFYSRAWNRAKQSPNKIVADFPILTAFELNSQAPNGVFTDGAKMVYSVEVSVMDSYRDDCQSKPKSCESRSINMIFQDTEILLKKVLLHLGSTVLVKIGEEYKILSMRQIGSIIYADSSTEYEIIYDIGAMLQSQNKGGNGFAKVEMATERLFGTKTRINFAVSNCLQVDYPEKLECFLSLNDLQGC